MSTFAVFIALTAGSAYAASVIDGRNLRNGSVTGAKVSDGSLGTVDLSAVARAALKGQRGATGAQGPKGADGAQGAQGAQGPKGADGAQGPAGPPGAADVNGSACTNGGTAGATRTVGLDGRMTLYCEVAEAADAHEPNETTGAATAFPLVGGTGAAALHAIDGTVTDGDVDYYVFSNDCSTDPRSGVDITIDSRHGGPVKVSYFWNGNPIGVAGTDTNMSFHSGNTNMCSTPSSTFEIVMRVEGVQNIDAPYRFHVWAYA